MTSTGPGHRGAYAKTERFRAEVLDAALRIVADEGFDAATLQAIADEVGRSKAGVLHHFGSRENLLVEIVRHRDATNSAVFPPDDHLEATIDLVAHNATVPGLVALFTVVAAQAAADPDDSERRRFFADRYRGTRASFIDRVRAAQGAGLVRTDLPADVAATLIISAMDGLQLQWLLDPTVDMAAHLRALFSVLAPPEAATHAVTPA